MCGGGGGGGGQLIADHISGSRKATSTRQELAEKDSISLYYITTNC